MDPNELENMRMKIDLSKMGKPALIGLAIIIVMVAVMAGRYAIDAATATEIKLERAEAVEPDNLDDASPGDTSMQSAEEPKTIFVHVSGAVKAPGLVELRPGSRVDDAIEAAGGPADDACIDAVNLARKVEDGEQVHLPDSSEVELSDVRAENHEALAVSGSPAGKININTASAGELEELPGIGPSTAQKIVAARESDGAFAAIEDLKRVSGIGDKKFEALEELICV